MSQPASPITPEVARIVRNELLNPVAWLGMLASVELIKSGRAL